MYFKVIVACGHLGHRREVEITRYFLAANAIEAWESAMIMPRSKKGQKSRCVRQVYEIDIYEFMFGKLEELRNPYLQIKREKARIA